MVLLVTLATGCGGGDDADADCDTAAVPGGLLFRDGMDYTLHPLRRPVDGGRPVGGVSFICPTGPRDAFELADLPADVAFVVARRGNVTGYLAPKAFLTPSSSPLRAYFRPGFVARLPKRCDPETTAIGRIVGPNGQARVVGLDTGRVRLTVNVVDVTKLPDSTGTLRAGRTAAFTSARCGKYRYLLEAEYR